MNRGPDAIVVGAGVAGPAVALGLARLGLRTTVYEAAPSPRDGAGLFLNLAPNGLNAAQALGVGDEVEALGFLNDRLAFQNEDGRPLAEVAVGGRTMMRGA
ncbi:MAG: FAD-dependent oxidoreductase, partial [Gemmatimonadaceae bacterium]